MSIITYFENHNPLRRPLNQPRRRPPNQPRRRSGRQDRKNGTVDLRHLDGVLQDLGFAPKPHPTIFTENEPDTVFDGLEKFQKANRLTVDGAVKNKDSETGIALNKAMAEFYHPSARIRPHGEAENALNANIKKFGIDPKRAQENEKGESDDDIRDQIEELEKEAHYLGPVAQMMAERLANETGPDARDKIEMELEKIKGEIEDIEDKFQILRQRLTPSREA